MPDLPPRQQLAAILRLLDDEDAATATLVQQKLAETQAPAQLRELRAMAAGRAARRLDELILAATQGDADAVFTALCASFGERGDLEEASWQLAATFSPGDDFRLERETLDGWGEEAAIVLAHHSKPPDRIRALAEFLHHDVRLRGNDEDYYNIKNSLLPRVIDTRRGIPITITLLYMLVGARAGMHIDGVGLPGHFLARHEDFFFDPFHGGRWVNIEECKALVEQQNLVLTPQHLQPTTPRQMLLRMLTNIFYIAQQTDPALAEKVGGWMEMLRDEPHAPI